MREKVTFLKITYNFNRNDWRKEIVTAKETLSAPRKIFSFAKPIYNNKKSI